MRKEIILITIIILLIINTLLTTCSLSKGTNNNSNIRNLIVTGDYSINLKYKGKHINVKFVKDNNEHIAYQLQYDLKNVQENELYQVMVEEMVNNRKLENVIKSGYPYKTPEQIGVQDSIEAQIVTQEAIYFILENRKWEDYEMTLPDDERFFNGIKNIINMANKLPDKKLEEGIGCIKKWTQDGNDEELTSQEYMVQTNSISGEYEVQLEIKEKNNKTTEIYVTDLQNNPKTIFSMNEKFKIVMKKSKDTLEGSIKIRIKEQRQDLLLLLAKPNTELTSNYVILETQNKTLALNTPTKFTNIKNILHILVTEKNTTTPINNAKFELIQEATGEKTELQTDSDGIITLEKLESGLYKLKQISTIEKHNISEKIEEIEVTSDSNITVKIENEKKEQQIDKNTFTPSVIENDNDDNNGEKIPDGNQTTTNEITNNITNEFGNNTDTNNTTENTQNNVENEDSAKQITTNKNTQKGVKQIKLPKTGM